MEERGLDGLFSSLSASFDAVVEREEDEAAADLAFSLGQDRSLEGSLRRGGFDLRIGGGGRRPVTEVGADYVGSGHPVAVVVPARLAVCVETPGS